MRHPAVCFPLGVHLEAELVERGWPADVAVRGTWMSAKRLVQILAGRHITFADAEVLAHIFGTSAALFLNLQLSYEKWLESTPVVRASGVDPPEEPPAGAVAPGH